MQMGAGAALGALVGLLVGLSASPVVASVAAALGAAAVSFFGLGGSIGRGAAAAGSARLLGFAIAMAIALVLGIVMRTHDWLAPTPAARVAAWRAAGIDAPGARALVIYERLGIAPAGATAAAPPAATPHDGILFADEAAGHCATLEADRFADPADRAGAMALAGPRWAALAAAVAPLPPAARDRILEAGWALHCSDRRP